MVVVIDIGRGVRSRSPRAGAYGPRSTANSVCIGCRDRWCREKSGQQVEFHQGQTCPENMSSPSEDSVVGVVRCATAVLQCAEVLVCQQEPGCSPCAVVPGLDAALLVLPFWSHTGTGVRSDESSLSGEGKKYLNRRLLWTGCEETCCTVATFPRRNAGMKNVSASTRYVGIL